MINPVKLFFALQRGRYNRTFDSVTATFSTSALAETVSIFHTFEKEGEIVEDLLESFQSGDVFYDVGANLGVFTCFGGLWLTEGEVVAFEPHPENVQQIRRNIQLNDIEATVKNLALSDTGGTATLTEELGRFGNQRHALSPGSGGGTIEVDTADADSLIRGGEISRPTVVKIDVEGAELRVIDGMMDALGHEDCHTVYCEIHPDLIANYNDSIAGVRRALEDAGFHLESIRASGGQSYLKGKK